MRSDCDPRIVATRVAAMDAAHELLSKEGVMAVSYSAVSAKTGISRSTLYRHWPTLNALRNSAFGRAASEQEFPPKTSGPLSADLAWLLGGLVNALNDTTWGQIAPQVVAAAASDDDAKAVINLFMQDRFENVREAFDKAKASGEIANELDVQPLIEVAISVPYFRKLIAGLPINQAWLESHVEMICRLAKSPE